MGCSHFAERITLKRLMQVSGWDSRLLTMAFKAVTGMSVREYVEKTRINTAAALLREGHKVESVAASVGWRGRSNFFHAFKRQIGVTPGSYAPSLYVGRHLVRSEHGEVSGEGTEPSISVEAPIVRSWSCSRPVFRSASRSASRRLAPRLC